MQIIAWIGLSQSLFAALLMLVRKNRLPADKLLSAWLCLLAIDFLSYGLDLQYYGQALLASSLLLFKILAYLTEQPFRMENFFGDDNRYHYHLGFSAINIASCLIYNVLSIRWVHLYRIGLKNERSTIEKHELLGWVLSISILYVSYCIIALILGGFTSAGWLSSQSLQVYNFAVLLFFTYLLGFYGSFRHQPPLISIPEPETLRSYKNSTLNEQDKTRIEKKIVDYIEGEKAYLNPELNMDMLSEKLKVP